MFGKSTYVTVVVLAVSTMQVEPAAASHKLGGTWSRDSIKAHCDAAGGAFMNGGSNGYGCFVGATGGSVQCTNQGKCTGSDPKALTGDPGRLGGKRAGSVGTLAGSAPSTPDSGPQMSHPMHGGGRLGRRLPQ